MKKNFIFTVIALALIASEAYSQTEDLFNGKDLSNWNFVVADDKVPASDVFLIKDKAILIKGNPFGYMYTKKKYRNYTLELEWSWVNQATNSGIFFLIADPRNPFPNGIECQLKAGNAGDLVLLGGSDLNEYVSPAGEARPAFPVIKKQKDTNEKPVGKWNKAKITVHNGAITVHINGLLQNQATSKVVEGYIGLQSEGGAIRFRNVKVKEDNSKQ